MPFRAGPFAARGGIASYSAPIRTLPIGWPFDREGSRASWGDDRRSMTYRWGRGSTPSPAGPRSGTAGHHNIGDPEPEWDGTAQYSTGPGRASTIFRPA